jgi:hypothetical protein
MTIIIGSQKDSKDVGKHSGAGVLFYNDTGIIVGHQVYKTILSKSPVYEEFGGGNHDSSSSVYSTAIKEVNEESANLITLSKKHLLDKKFIDVPARDNKYYRLFFAYYPDFPIDDFKVNNKLVMGNPKIKNYYKEVNGLTIIPFKNLEKATFIDKEYQYFGKGIIKEKRAVVKNINDKDVQLSGRLKIALYELNGLNMFKKNSEIKLKSAKVSSGPLKGTINYSGG